MEDIIREKANAKIYEVEITFQPSDKLAGECFMAEENTGARIYIDSKRPRFKQLKTLFHEFGHMTLNMFHGSMALNIDEEKFCDELEEAVAQVYKKHIKKSW